MRDEAHPRRRVSARPLPLDHLVGMAQQLSLAGGVQTDSGWTAYYASLGTLLAEDYWPGYLQELSHK